MSFFTLVLLMSTAQVPEWEVQLPYTPMNGALLAERGDGAMAIFVPMGDHGLGGWDGDGAALPGFPVAADEGVTKRPAGCRTPEGRDLVVFPDNEGSVHAVYHDGSEAPGWPVFVGPSIVSGVSVVDLDDDGEPEVAFGTADARVHLLELDGSNADGWPATLPAQLQWQPSQLSLGGGYGYGLVCGLVSTDVYVLAPDGSVLPGWPVDTGYSSGSVPVTGDIDADGLGDVVVATYNGRLYAVRSSGSRLDGWPFFLDDRTTRGPVAIGRLDPDIEGLQVAVSTVDSTVTLIDGDGSLAGTWRWPNRIGGRPTAPIIARTHYGMAVIVGCSDGLVYAWNAEGRSLEGYPADLGQSMAHPPAAGDVDGDGHLELVVMGRSGRLAAWTLSGLGSSPGPWPQAMSDQGNCGCFGSSFLPRATAGALTGEQSGNVVLPYEISDGGATGVTLAYSTNAGFTWTETPHFADRGGEVVWYSEEDLPGTDVYECMLKMTPYQTQGPGVSAISNIFHLDNNIPPSVYLSNPEEVSDGKFSIHYAVEDPEGDVIQLQAQYSTDGETWHNAHLRGSTVEIEPWFYGEPFTWYAVEDLGNADIEGISLRVRGADADPGPWSVITDIHLDTDRLPSGQVLAPSEEVGGDVELGVRLSDPEEDPLEVSYEYSTDGGSNWHPATVIGSSEPVVGTHQYEITWASEADLPEYDGIRVRFRVVPRDLETGIAVPSAPFHVDNNEPPSVEVLSPGDWDSFSGRVPISLSITDGESDNVQVGLQYRISGTDSWIRADGLDARSSYPPSAYRSVINWNSTEDVPELEGVELYLRVSASDGDTTFSDVVGPISVDNSRVPSVMHASLREVDTDARLAYVTYELADPRERTLDLRVTYSIDEGETWSEATVAGDLLGRHPSSYEGEVEWHYSLDLGGRSGGVLLKLTPSSGTVLGTPRTIETAFN